jgi:hypothetical protein
MYHVRDVLDYIEQDNGETAKSVGMEYFFSDDESLIYTPIGSMGVLNLLAQDSFIQQLRNTEVNSHTDQKRKNIMKLHSLGMVSTYAFLTKMHTEGSLEDHPQLKNSYFYIRNIVERQILHATMGPPGQYMGYGYSSSNIVRVHPQIIVDKIKSEANAARSERDVFATSASTELVELLYDQIPLRMDAMAKVMGGAGNADYVEFAEEAIDALT